MTSVGLHQDLAGYGAGMSIWLGVPGNTTNGWQDKSADLGRAHVVGWVRFFDYSKRQTRWRAPTKSQGFQRAERHRMLLARAWRR